MTDQDGARTPEQLEAEIALKRAQLAGTVDDLEDQLHPDSTARQDNPYPQGDLP